MVSLVKSWLAYSDIAMDNTFDVASSALRLITNGAISRARHLKVLSAHLQSLSYPMASEVK